MCQSGIARADAGSAKDLPAPVSTKPAEHRKAEQRAFAACELFNMDYVDLWAWHLINYRVRLAHDGGD